MVAAVAVARVDRRVTAITALVSVCEIRRIDRQGLRTRVIQPRILASDREAGDKFAGIFKA